MLKETTDAQLASKEPQNTMTSTNSDTDATSMPHAQLSAVERLTREFGANFTRDMIARTVAGSIADLAGVPIADLPELAERVARQRLFTALELQPEWASFERGEPTPNNRVMVASTGGGMSGRAGGLDPVTERDHTAIEYEGP